MGACMGKGTIMLAREIICHDAPMCEHLWSEDFVIRGALHLERVQNEHASARPSLMSPVMWWMPAWVPARGFRVEDLRNQGDIGELTLHRLQCMTSCSLVYCSSLHGSSSPL